jgi:hypothetical protein
VYSYGTAIRATTDVCANGCFGRGRVMQLRGPGECGVSAEMWESKPQGYSVYHCSRCRIVYYKKPRASKEFIRVGFWDRDSKMFTPYSPS